jgi:hypothetical protein
MAWPVEAVLLLMALAGCLLACVALQLAYSWRSWPLALVGSATFLALLAEVGALNGSFGPVLAAGVGVPTLILAGVAVAGLAVYLLLPPPAHRPADRHRPTGPAANPDSEA